MTKPVSYLLFDLDNTLYRASSGLSDEMDMRMTRFVARHMGMSLEEAGRLRHQGYVKYGTTLRWLIEEAGLDNPMDFLQEVHPAEVGDYIAHEPGLRRLLDSIPLRKAVLTNSPLFHAERVLEHCGIRPCFERVFDLVFNQYKGKPDPSSYLRVLDNLGLEAGEVLFIDDVPRYLEGFRALGGQCLLVDEGGWHLDAGFPAIGHMEDLPGWLAGQTRNNEV